MDLKHSVAIHRDTGRSISRRPEFVYATFMRDDMLQHVASYVHVGSSTMILSGSTCSCETLLKYVRVISTYA